MPTLTITIGLPGCGKTTWARMQDIVRVNRDDLRFMMYGRYVITKEEETIVSIAQEAQVRALLRGGYSVINDDTNMNQRTVDKWRRLADNSGAAFMIKDMTNVTSAVCKSRVAYRVSEGGRYVPDEVIDRMAERLP